MLLDQVRGPLTDLLGQPVPGASLRKLAAISAGCSTADPTTAVLDLALELAAFVPPTGLDQIDLPDLPGIDIPVPPEVIDLLEPLAPAIREGCANLATVAVLFVVLPPAVQPAVLSERPHPVPRSRHHSVRPLRRAGSVTAPSVAEAGQLLRRGLGRYRAVVVTLVAALAMVAMFPAVG